MLYTKYLPVFFSAIAGVIAEGGPFANFTVTDFTKGCSPGGCIYRYDITGTDMPFTTSCYAAISHSPNETFYCDEPTVSFTIPDGRTLNVWNNYTSPHGAFHVANGSYIFSCRGQAPAMSFRIIPEGASCVGLYCDQ